MSPKSSRDSALLEIIRDALSDSELTFSYFFPFFAFLNCLYRPLLDDYSDDNKFVSDTFES
jgi:hypothetical protein